MTNTKLCSECRYQITVVEQIEKFQTACAITLRTMPCKNEIKRSFMYLCEKERQNESGCGPDGKHFEPIGGADNEKY